MPPSKMAEWFENRRWRVVDANGTAFIPNQQAEAEEEPLIRATFRHGRFTVDSPGAFSSPLSGNPGRHGILLQEVDADGVDIPGSRYPFGVPVVKDARTKFRAIV